jgi:hypothetical protein
MVAGYFRAFLIVIELISFLGRDSSSGCCETGSGSSVLPFGLRSEPGTFGSNAQTPSSQEAAAGVRLWNLDDLISRNVLHESDQSVGRFRLRIARIRP